MISRLEHGTGGSRSNGNITHNKMVQNRINVRFRQNGFPAHTSKLAQKWWNLPKFIAKEEWPGNSGDFSPIENLWAILKAEIYKRKDPSRMVALS